MNTHSYGRPKAFNRMHTKNGMGPRLEPVKPAPTPKGDAAARIFVYVK